MTSFPINCDQPPASSEFAERRVRFKIAIASASVAFAIFYLALELFLRKHLLEDPDTSLHIAVGNWILHNGRFPVTDKFSYTVPDGIWRATDWISEIAFAALYHIGGWNAVAEAVSVTVGVLAGILNFYLATKLRLSIAVGLTAIVILIISPHFLARPLIFAYPLLLVWLALVLDIEDRDRWAELKAYGLVPLMLLWANVHGGFTLGLVVLYLFAGPAAYKAYRAKDRKKLKQILILAFAVAIGATITPYGIFSALKTVRLLNVPVLTQIQEWAPPNFADDKIHLAFIVGIFAILIYYGVKLRGGRLLTLLLMFVFALEHNRGLGLFGLVAPLMIVRPLSALLPWFGAATGSADPVVKFVRERSGTIVLLCTLVVIVVGAADWVIAPPTRPPNGVAPKAAVAAAERDHLNGNVINGYEFGGYLALRGIPTFVDGRVGLYGNRFLERYFRLTYRPKKNEVDKILDKYNISWALLRPSNPIAAVLKAKGWRQIYQDHSAIVLAKNG